MKIDELAEELRHTMAIRVSGRSEAEYELLMRVVAELEERAIRLASVRFWIDRHESKNGGLTVQLACMKDGLEGVETGVRLEVIEDLKRAYERRPFLARRATAPPVRRPCATHGPDCSGKGLACVPEITMDEMMADAQLDIVINPEDRCPDCGLEEHDKYGTLHKEDCPRIGTDAQFGPPWKEFP